MDSALGVIALVVYIAVIVGLAAAITWLVIKLSPGKDKKKPAPEPDAAA